VFSDIARASRQSDETLGTDGDNFGVTLNTLTNSQSFLTFDLGYLADKRATQLQEQLRQGWVPNQPDVTREAYPIRSYDEYKALSPEEQRLGLVVYAPAKYKEAAPMGFN